MKDLSEANVTTYHYEYDANGNRTTVEIKDDGLTLESTVYTYDRLNKLVSSREVTASGLYIYEYTYDDNGNLTKEDRHRAYELNTNQWTNIRRYEYTKDNKLEAVYSGNILLVAYTYDGDGTITSTLDRDLDLNQNLNIHDHNYLNSLTNNQRQLINKVSSNDSFLYELTEYVTDKNRPYSETLMERDGTGQLSTVYTYGNQRINSESYNNLTGLYTYDGRGSVSAVIGGYGDFRASYWYDGLGNVKSQIYGYGAFGSGKKYYGYNADQYNPVTGNQNLRARQVNIRRQRFLTEDTFLGTKDNTLTLNRYIYGNGNPLKYKDPSGNVVIESYLLYEIALIIGGLITATYASIKLRETYRNHPVDIFSRSYIPQSPIIDIPPSDIPTTNVDIYPKVETPSSNILVTPTENVIGNSIVGDIIVAEENSAQIVCDKEEVDYNKNIESKNEKLTDAIKNSDTCKKSNNSAKVNYNGEEVSVYRGVKNYDNRFKLRSSDIKLDENGNISTKSGGSSVNVDPNRVTNFGKAYELKSLPDGLKIEQSGSDPGHFEVRPQYPMSVQEYQDLLNQIELFK